MERMDRFEVHFEGIKRHCGLIGLRDEHEDGMKIIDNGSQASSLRNYGNGIAILLKE